MSAAVVRSCALALVIAIVAPGTAVAQRRGGAGGAPPSRSAAPVARAAPPQAARPVGPTEGGFNFNRDLTARPAPAPAPQRVAAPSMQQRSAPAPRRPIASYRPAPNAPGSGPYTGGFHGPAIPNPHRWSGSWGWNHGVAWRPAPIYWGGGFWGPWAVGALTGAVFFGSIVDDQAQLAYPSYQVEPDSPGAQLLQNYALQQTPCGPPGLVVIWGPDNSVICAFPNDNVGPGEYQLDPATLTIVSE